MPYNKINENDIKHLEDAVGKEHVFTGEDVHEDFTHDEMMEYGCFSPDAVVEAMTTEQVSQIMQLAYERNIPGNSQRLWHWALRRMRAYTWRYSSVTRQDGQHKRIR